jgi:hypothetical protein
MAAGGAGEEDAIWGLGGCVTPAASGFRPDSITSVVAGGVTTGAIRSGLTFPGSGPGRSAVLAAGGAEKEDAGWDLGNSPALAASGFGGAITGFSITVSGAGGGVADGVLDPLDSPIRTGLAALPASDTSWSFPTLR